MFKSRDDYITVLTNGETALDYGLRAQVLELTEHALGAWDGSRDDPLYRDIKELNERASIKHLLQPGIPELSPGDKITAWTPGGYIVGTVRSGNGDYNYNWDSRVEIELDGPLGRLCILEYVAADRGWGPHWYLSPDYASYHLGCRDDWDRLNDIFGPGWKKSITRDSCPA